MRYIFICCTFFGGLYLFAQEIPKTHKPIWTRQGFFSLQANQVSLTNWAAGGQEATSGTAIFNYAINLKDTILQNGKKKILQWDNSLDMAYGLIKTNSDPIRKNEDKIDLNSKFGYDAFGKWYYSGLLNFKSQFAPGYQLPNDSIIVSRFLSPAWLLTSIGLDWKPKSWFSLYLSPVTGKFTFVQDTALSNQGMYGVEKRKKFRPELGAYARISFKKDVMKNVNLQSRLELFNNFTDKKLDNRRNVDINWETTLNMKVNKYISASFFLHLIYDHDIPIKVTEIINGQEIVQTGPRLQIKNVLGVGFSYKF